MKLASTMDLQGIHSPLHMASAPSSEEISLARGKWRGRSPLGSQPLDGGAGPTGVTERQERSIGRAITAAVEAASRAAGPDLEVRITFRGRSVHLQIMPTGQEPETRSAEERPGGPFGGAGSGPTTGSFGEWMRELLTERGLTQEAAARLLGVSVKTVSRWVTGATEPRLRELSRLYETFAVLPPLVGSGRARQRQARGA